MGDRYFELSEAMKEIDGPFDNVKTPHELVNVKTFTWDRFARGKSLPHS